VDIGENQERLTTDLVTFLSLLHLFINYFDRSEHSILRINSLFDSYYNLILYPQRSHLVNLSLYRHIYKQSFYKWFWWFESK